MDPRPTPTSSSDMADIVLLAEKEAAGVFTAANPGSFSAEKHVPNVSIDQGVAKIVIPHGYLPCVLGPYH